MIKQVSRIYYSNNVKTEYLGTIFYGKLYNQPAFITN